MCGIYYRLILCVEFIINRYYVSNYRSKLCVEFIINRYYVLNLL